MADGGVLPAVELGGDSEWDAEEEDGPVRPRHHFVYLLEVALDCGLVMGRCEGGGRGGWGREQLAIAGHRRNGTVSAEGQGPRMSEGLGQSECHSSGSRYLLLPPLELSMSVGMRP